MDKPDLIDRKALLEHSFDSTSITGYHYPVVAVDEIKTAPAVDAEPVRHGRWIDIYPASKAGKRCSVCRTIRCINTAVNNWSDMRYCPHCGAKMDAKED